MTIRFCLHFELRVLVLQPEPYSVMMRRGESMERNPGKVHISNSHRTACEAIHIPSSRHSAWLKLDPFNVLVRG